MRYSDGTNITMNCDNATNITTGSILNTTLNLCSCGTSPEHSPPHYCGACGTIDGGTLPIFIIIWACAALCIVVFVYTLIKVVRGSQYRFIIWQVVLLILSNVGTIM